MATQKLSEIKAEIERLQAEYDAVLTSERTEKLAEVREIIAAYGFTSDDLFSTKKAKTKRNFDPANTKLYRNPETGDEYRGKGKPPASFVAAGPDLWRTWEVK